MDWSQAEQIWPRRQGAILSIRRLKWREWTSVEHLETTARSQGYRQLSEDWEPELEGSDQQDLVDRMVIPCYR